MSAIEVLVRLLAVLGGFRLLGLGLSRWALPSLPASGYALATAAGLALSVHLTWLLVHAGLALGPASIALGLAGAGALALAAARAVRRRGGRLRPDRRSFLVHHAAFTVALALALAITARNPAVDPDSERLMDYAMTGAVLAARSLPLEDPWLGGMTVSYYDYGYFWVGYLSLLIGPLEHFFPVAVALCWAALFTGVTAIGLDAAGWRGALLAPFLTSVAGNLDAVRQTIGRGLAAPLDWFHAARVIPGTITEFPFFSLLWGDLHPYVLALVLWPLLLAIAMELHGDRAGIGSVVVGAAAYAALVATHTWDAVPVAAVLLLAALAGPGRVRAVPRAAVVVGCGALLALPFLLRAPTAGRGLEWVAARSSLVDLVTVWVVPVAVLVAAALGEMVRAGRDAALAPVVLAACLLLVAVPGAGVGLASVGAAVALWLVATRAGVESFAWCLGAVGAGLVAGVELLYVDDFYGGELERMNTVFKTYVAAWVLFSVASAMLLPRLLDRARGTLPRAGSLAATALLVAAAALYPVRATAVRAGDLLSPRPLDSRLAFAARYPDDARAAERLKRLPRGVLLEATGDPYTWNGRFATFTGYPTVVGWGHHEAGWRNTWEPMLERAREVEAAYADPTLGPLREAVRRHGVRYLVVGALERERYPAPALGKFDSLEVAVREGETVIYHVGDGR